MSVNSLDSAIGNAAAILRPTFREGQILGSGDLDRLIQYPRDQDARHERYLHTWGLAHGLSVEERNGEFVLQPGFAIDSSGAPIVVARPIVLSVAQLYDEALPGDEDDKKLFPLFVVRTQEEQIGNGFVSRCSDGGASRISEGAAVRFRPFATDWDVQPPDDISQGPVDKPESDRVVLVGFVEWRLDENSPVGRIADFQRRDRVSGIGPRYAGVAADEVVGRAGEVVVRSSPPDTQDAPAIVVGDHDTGDDRKAFAIGLDNGRNGINNVLTVDPQGNVYLKGNLEAEGTLKGQIRTGEVAIESGIASDGMILPLPEGIKTEMVSDGEVVLHITVTPRIDPELAPTSDPDTDIYLPAVTECDVDEDRRVRCTIRWHKVSGNANDVVTVAGTVNYTAMATVVEGEGGAQ